MKQEPDAGDASCVTPVCLSHAQGSAERELADNLLEEPKMSTSFMRSVTFPVGLERPLFGQVLRHFVGLRSEQLEDALEVQRCGGGRLGAILCQRGLIAREHITQVLRQQARWLATALRGDLPRDTFPYHLFLSLCLPVYNEQDNIEDTLDSACAILPEFVERYEIVVVDDGSRDKTAEVLSRYARMNPQVRLVAHAQNQGYGGAVTSGLRAAEGDLIVFTDSDGQFSFLDLPQLLTRLEGADVVIGYRCQRADRWMRLFNAWAWNRLIRLVLGVRVRDLDCAFKLFRRSVIECLSLTSRGAAINAEILAQCVHGGLTIRETPVTHYPRYSGAPTGAAVKVILRAFRELPSLWKYRRTSCFFKGAEAPSSARPFVPMGDYR